MTHISRFVVRKIGIDYFRRWVYDGGMFGYITEKKAVTYGMTHHGLYYWIPIWISQHSGSGFSCCAKWIPLDYMIPMISSAEMFLRAYLFPDNEPCFQFKIGKRIKNEKDM